MTTMTSFWSHLTHQTTTMRHAHSVSEVLQTFRGTDHPSDAGDGFYDGDAGTLWGALVGAGWTPSWSTDAHCWCLIAPTGEPLTFIDGELYRGDLR